MYQKRNSNCMIQGQQNQIQLKNQTLNVVLEMSRILTGLGNLGIFSTGKLQTAEQLFACKTDLVNLFHFYCRECTSVGCVTIDKGPSVHKYSK